MKKVVTVTPNVAIDKTLIIENFSPGKVTFVKKTFIYPSGKGINISRGLKRLGLNSLATGFVGGTTGKFIEENLKKENINFDFVHVKDETRINTTLIDPILKTETHIVEPGCSVEKTDIELLIQKFKNLVKGSSFACFSGSLPLNCPSDLYAQLIKIAKEHNLMTLVDTREEALSKAVKEIPDIIKPNKDELSGIINKPIKTNEDIISGIDYLLSLGIKMIFVTLGKEGAIGGSKEGYWLATPPGVDAVNTRGCGDAFASGIIYGLLKKKDFKDILRLGVACGTANALVDGPCFFESSQMSDIFPKIIITPISTKK